MIVVPFRCRSFLVCCFLASVATGSGCGGRSDLPDLGRVSGVVTFNGKPVPSAKVVFRPMGDGGGRMAKAVTNEAGQYRLIYLEYPSMIYGATPGPQMVVITTLFHGDDPGGPKPETLPACYQGPETVLKVDVAPGKKQQIDWKLDDKCGQ